MEERVAEESPSHPHLEEVFYAVIASPLVR